MLAAMARSSAKIRRENLPDHLTRAEVADVLRVSPRQVDRLARSGALTKVKLSASRSGFERGELDRYLRSMRGAGSYHSQLEATLLQLPRGTPLDLVSRLAELADANLRREGLSCIVSTEDRAIIISWNAALGYTAERVQRATGLPG